MSDSVQYYNDHAQSFIDNTINVDMQPVYQAFLRYLPDDAHVLDVGCGTGRDSLHFKNLGYQVSAMDYSAALVQFASEHTGLAVRHQSFLDINENEIYDGIWACASLLHCEQQALPTVLNLLIAALKPNGVLYMSFKYGDSQRHQDGRTFTDVNEALMANLLKPLDAILLLQQWISSDQRQDRSEDWLNIILKKQR